MGYFLDFVVVVVLIGSLAIGLWRGLILEVLDLVAIIAGAVTTAVCQRYNFGNLPPIAGHESLAGLLSMLLQFAASTIVVWGLGRLLRKLIHWTPMAFLDYLGGGVVAVVKAVVLLSLFLVTLMGYQFLSNDWLQQSITFPLLIFPARVILVLFPEQFVQIVRGYLEGK